MTPDNSELIQTGLKHHQSGRIREAEAIYQSILRKDPRHPDALHLLGVLALQVGKGEIAVDLIEKAIEVNPEEPQFYNMCGEAYRALRNYDVAISRYEKALAIQPDFAGAHINLGNTFKETGRLEDAAASYRKAIAISPEIPMSYNNLGVVLKDLGRPDEAIAHYEKALSIAPDYAEAHTNLGNALLALDRAEEAVVHHRRAIDARPDNAEAHSNLGNALKASGQLEEAAAHYRQALDINPRFAMAHYNLGIAFDELGRPEEAATSYEQAIAIDPHYAEAHHNLANALDELGRREDAIAHYEQALAIRPDYAEAHRNLTRLRPQQERVPAIEKLLENPSLSEADAIQCHFALGNIFHKVKYFDKAFEHFEIGNGLKRRDMAYSSENVSAYVDRLIDVYSKNYFQETTATGSGSELPVFIVGMPRSGTSLVEQIISSHTQVYGAGELASLGRFERSIARQFEDSAPYPDCMRQYREPVIAEYAEKYLEELGSYTHDAQRVTDKMPDNFLRIGLIKTLFPKARIIHCQRNALDTCTSNFLNYFATGNAYSFDLEELGHYYLDYERLMTHWTSVFSSEILNVQYEELVQDQEIVSRQMVEYLGLEWDERCLDFHKNERAVHNFSSMQVRQQIYARSINRWKDYENQLAPLLEILPHTATEVPI